MEYILIELPNEEYYNHKIKQTIIQPNLKLFVDKMKEDKISGLSLVSKDSTYLSLALDKDDSSVKQNPDGTYSFSPSSVKYIVINPPEQDRGMNKNYHRLCLEIAILGRYIPVVSTNGTLLFAEDYFNYIRNQMNGLSHYGLEDKFELASKEELLMDSVELEGKTYDVKSLAKQIEACTPKTEMLRDVVIATIEEKFESEGISVDIGLLNNPEIDVELIDIGSTGRGTNLPGDGDFDFMMRISGDDYFGTIQAYSTKILDMFGLKRYETTVTGRNDLRLKNIFIPGEKEPVAIDVTFSEKSPKVTYSTEMCAQDRLNTIKEKYPEQYNLVLANIVVAKSFLKDFRAYKKKNAHADKQGGMGGIGVETWVLQHGGSFLRASKSFLNVAHQVAQAYGNDLNSLIEFAQNNEKELIDNVISAAHGGKVKPGYDKLLDVFNTFQSYYPIYDFGENHKIGKSDSRRNYPHDDFVYNMNAVGFYKMAAGILKYMRKLEEQKNSKKTI